MNLTEYVEECRAAEEVFTATLNEAIMSYTDRIRNAANDVLGVDTPPETPDNYTFGE
jgi:hypothetical protein